MYQRFLSPDFKPYDLLELAMVTEKIVTREGPEGQERKYTGFYSVLAYGGVATGFAAGCCLRCFYCWSNWSGDFPEKQGEFYSPGEAASRLFRAAEEGLVRYKRLRKSIPQVNKLRISGSEPTIGKEHLLAVLELVQASEYPLFIS
ncbi:hypothetical protein FTO70_15660 [Methanosarcina sp. KYL-1]|uniref:hypothetical protein n=1 Tax=Methanosarcina sp. KYL-1 TaxID=2602068 RepID=UPI002100C525|nr:hypothetical protein [Methanosarcina sp. KYL-1]MCQ1537082.1 hypothetical protein [Methanosarcina sp. KYL-1]